MVGLQRLLNPRSIAIVGASNDTGKIRGRVLFSLIGAGFEGAIYPVNPSSSEIQGIKAYPSVEAIPDKVDLAIVAVAADQVMPVLEACATAGVGGAIVFASGFAEGGEDGAAAQERITELSERTGMRVLGPNTLGFYNLPGRIAANFSPIITARLSELRSTPPQPGGIDIICQSGGLGFSLYSRAVESRIPVRNVITTGNEADCECLEIAEHLLEQGGTRTLLLFVEGFRNPERLQSVAALAAQCSVPVLVTKIGRSDASQRAAVSHTGHLTGSDAVYDAVFSQFGLIRVADPDEMMAMAAALSKLPLARGNRVAIVTTSGGTGGWAADILSAEGLEISMPGIELRAKLDALIPGFGSSANPIDVTAAVLEDGGVALTKTIAAIADSGEFDAVLVILSLAGRGRIKSMRQVLEPLLERRPIPIIFHSPGIPTEDNLVELEAIGVPHMTLRAAGIALRTLRRYGAFQQSRKQAQPPAEKPVAPATGIKTLFDIPALQTIGRAELRSVLDYYGIATPPEAVMNSVGDAVKAATKMGFPVAMKAESADIPHKTDAGCVVLGVSDAEACAKAYTQIVANARRNAPDARVEGVLIQKMMPAGLEMVAGMTNDRDFGPVIMLGFGGVYVEILRDSVIQPAPVSLADAHRMIDSLKGSQILKGARGQPPADTEALARVLVGLSNLSLHASGTIREIDLNPVIVYPKGQGVAVVDHLFVCGAPADSDGY